MKQLFHILVVAAVFSLTTGCMGMENPNDDSLDRVAENQVIEVSENAVRAERLPTLSSQDGTDVIPDDPQDELMCRGFIRCCTDALNIFPMYVEERCYNVRCRADGDECAASCESGFTLDVSVSGCRWEIPAVSDRVSGRPLRTGSRPRMSR